MNFCMKCVQPANLLAKHVMLPRIIALLAREIDYKFLHVYVHLLLMMTIVHLTAPLVTIYVIIAP